MQLHLFAEIEATDIESFRETTEHRYDEIIARVQEEDQASDEDWDHELVSSVEAVLNRAHPDKLICGEWFEHDGWARWEIYEIPEELNDVVFRVIEKDLEEMPTLINSQIKPEQDLAKWRLENGV